MMRIFSVLLKKEFKLISRNRVILIISTLAPLLQFLILPMVASYEFKNINLAIIDHDHSSWSSRLINKIKGSGYFIISGYENNFSEALIRMEKNEADVILQIPPGFEKNLVREKEQNLLVAINAINGTKAAIGGNYLGDIIKRFNKELTVEAMPVQGAVISRPNSIPLHRFNPNYNYRMTLVPGILCILVTMIGGFMASLNIVEEKEKGTIEQINVSPISKVAFILSKLIPFLIISNFIFSVGLILTKVIYGIGLQGDLITLYVAINIYILSVLGLGLLISTFANNQYQAIFIMYFLIMIFMLMSGLFTPVESMPDWARFMVHFIPLYYMIDVIRLIMLKGSGLIHILPQLSMMALLAVGLILLAMLNYRKTT